MPRPPHQNPNALAAPTPQQIKIHQIKQRAAPLIDSGQYSLAIDLLESVLPLDRRDGLLHKMLGVSYSGVQNTQRALIHLGRAAELGFDDTDTMLSLAAMQKDAGDTRSSLRIIEKLLVTSPSDGRAHRFKAFLLRSMGDGAAALAWIDTAHAKIGPHPETMILRAELLDRFGRREEAERDLETILADPATPAESRRDALYALGRILDATGRYDDAFAAIAKANNMLPAVDVVTPAMFRERWTAEAIQSIPAVDTPSDRPVFVIGMPRSGTTLTEQILAAHPSVATVGESAAMNQAARHLLPAQLDGPTLETIAAGYLSSTLPNPVAGNAKKSPKISRVVDKMPENYYFLPIIRRALPNASIIHCTRDPRDVALSCYFQNFGARLAWSRRLETIAAQFDLYRSAIDLWEETLEADILESNYEQLTSDPRPAVEAMLTHIGLPFDEACLHHHKSRSVVHTASVDQVRNPIYTSSQQRWKRYENHLSPILEALTR